MILDASRCGPPSAACKLLRVGTLFAIVAAVLSARANPVDVRQAPYRHWRDAWRVSNGEFELVVTPAVGRVMRYGRVGGENVLWEGGDPPPDQYGWPNHGGEKLWIAPQAAWGWPPPASFDPGSWSVVRLEDGVRLSLVQPVPPGLQVERTVRLAPTGSVATIESTIANVSSATVARAAWHIAQVPPRGKIVAPLRRTTDFPDGFAFYAEHPASARTSVTVEGDRLFVGHRNDVGFKLGLPREAGVLEHRTSSHTLVMSARLPVGHRYPDGGKAWQVASVAKKSAYFEMEACSPLVALGAGDSVALKTTWQILPPAAR